MFITGLKQNIELFVDTAYTIVILELRLFVAICFRWSFEAHTTLMKLGFHVAHSAAKSGNMLRYFQRTSIKSSLSLSLSLCLN